MSYSVGRRHGSHLTLLWLWRRLAAVALIRPLAWEPPYATGVALKIEKQKSDIYRGYWQKMNRRVYPKDTAKTFRENTALYTLYLTTDVIKKKTFFSNKAFIYLFLSFCLF